jgi:hypothetical protein
MIRTHVNRPFSFGLLILGILISSAEKADAYTISLTGDTSDGNPGGQPIYQVSGLVQGDAFNISWGGVSGLSANAMLTVSSLTATTADIDVMLTNASTQTSGTSPRITSFGLNVSNYSDLGSTATGGTYLDLADDGNFPGFGGVDACATSGSNCAGGGSGGIPYNGTDNFTLQLEGNFTTLTLSDFGLKIQGAAGGASYELAGVPTPKPTNTDVPEPAAAGLLLLGVSLFAARWRQRR